MEKALPGVGMSFLVIDTEGKDSLKEIAIIDSKGRVVYHGFNQAEHPRHPECRPLSEIIAVTHNIMADHRLVFHYAEHDLGVLSQAFQLTGRKLPRNPTACTWELAKELYPTLGSYSLEYLSKELGLKVNGAYFNSSMAHSADYDALYTYKLYCNLQERIKVRLEEERFPNPFSSIRVDSPFQSHDDNLDIYANEFNYLKKILNDIDQDANHQSLGCVLIGEPGTGKTHLIMRLAQQLLSQNRLFFIRCPNNADSIFYHIYTRTLESLIQKVNGDYTQLEYLLAKSFIKILSLRLENTGKNLTASEREILNLLKENPFNLFQKLGVESSKIYHSRWDLIEKHLTRWWTDKYANAGNSVDILRGIAKFCRYRDPLKRDRATRWLAGNVLETQEAESIDLPNWLESVNQEDFSLQAMKVLGALSILDRPTIIVFDQLESLSQYPDICRRLGECLKEIYTHVPNSLIICNLFPDRWTYFQNIFDSSVIDRISQHKITLHAPSPEQIKQILQLRLRETRLELECLFSDEEMGDIIDNPSIRSIINRSAEYYRFHIEKIPLPDKIHVIRTEESVHQFLSRLESEIIGIKEILASHNLSKVKEPQAPSQVEPPKTSPKPTVEKPFANNNQVQIQEYLTQKEDYLRGELRQDRIVSDTDDIGKLRHIGDAFKTIRPIRMGVTNLGKRVIPENILFYNTNQVIGITSKTGSPLTARLKNWNDCVIGNKHLTFTLVRYEHLKNVIGASAVQHIKDLQGVKNAHYKIFTPSDRLFLELLYALVTDIQNRDLEIEMGEALSSFIELKPHWLLDKIL